MDEGQPIKVFISYSWDNKSHQNWVHDFAVRLHGEGIQVIFDQWDIKIGRSLPHFMEWAVRESDFVICVCTPSYKKKSDLRTGGVGYEGHIMTAELFNNPEEGKFLPILRKGNWEEAAPSWLLAMAYEDFRDEPCDEQKYKNLAGLLKKNKALRLPVGTLREEEQDEESNDDFVNRKIELAALDIAELESSYSQCALISAPAGYGKSRLLSRVLETMSKNSNGPAAWNWRYIDFSKRGALRSAIAYFWEQVCQAPFTSEYDADAAHELVCGYILDTMSASMVDKSSCGVLILLDAVDCIMPEDEPWLFSVFNEVVTGSYVSYKKGSQSFPVRLVLAGRQVEAFWRRYQDWETASGCKYHLRSANSMPLSPFAAAHVEELVQRKVKKDKSAHIDQSQIADIAEKLMYFSGGHPGVINGILDELVNRKFRQFDEYLNRNVERLIKLHISGVVRQIFERYESHLQQDIKTVLVFRMVTLDMLEVLRSRSLISWKEDNSLLLAFLRDSQFLHFDDATSFYHDDVLRRIIYLDFLHGAGEQREHIRAVHRCAVEYYEMLIGQASQQKSIYFIEWLFHCLQLPGLSQGEILSKWKALLSKIRPAPILPDDLKKAIVDGLRKDAEIRHLYRLRFETEDFSILFEKEVR